jgi:hypothetical protein
MMKPVNLQYNAVQGKTFSLFGDSDSTQEYYQLIARLADEASRMESDIEKLIGILARYSSKKRFMRRLARELREDSLIARIISLITPGLEKYTTQTGAHLKELPLLKTWDRRLATTREQYHLYMLEIELTNRLFFKDFIQSDQKIGLLPHCLHDLGVICKAAKDGFDYQCKHCSKSCYQHAVSSLLRKNGIEPYIWMGGDFKKLAKETLKSGQSFAVLGIACIPELVMGMRRCRKHHIPVIGLPLNANRCIRWFGEFRPNSVDLVELEKLIISGFLKI